MRCKRFGKVDVLKPIWALNQWKPQVTAKGSGKDPLIAGGVV
jgi:hypothetical protein